MADPSDLVPEEPEEAGVPEREPDSAHVEGAQVLADEAEEVLGPQGFGHDQIREWAESYIAERGSGDVDDFVEWIRAKERAGTDG